MSQHKAQPVTSRNIKEITTLVRQFLTNATLADEYGMHFAAGELAASIATLQRLHARVLAQAVLDKAAVK